MTTRSELQSLAIDFDKAADSFSHLREIDQPTLEAFEKRIVDASDKMKQIKSAYILVLLSLEYSIQNACANLELQRHRIFEVNSNLHPIVKSICYLWSGFCSLFSSNWKYIEVKNPINSSQCVKEVHKAAHRYLNRVTSKLHKEMPDYTILSEDPPLICLSGTEKQLTITEWMLDFFNHHHGLICGIALE